MKNKTSMVKRLIMQALSALRLHCSFPKSNDFTHIPPRLDPYSTRKNQIQFKNEETFKEEEEMFDFAPFDDQRALMFSYGKIQTTSTISNQYSVKASNRKSNKSKSTSFSKTWRFWKSFKLRSNSGGKGAFVLLNTSRSMKLRSTKANKDSGTSKKGKTTKCKTTLSPQEKFYLMNKRKNETIRRRSFLPYRQNLIGFFKP